MPNNNGSAINTKCESYIRILLKKIIHLFEIHYHAKFQDPTLNSVYVTATS